MAVQIDTKHCTALVDEEDADLAAHKWFASIRGRLIYLQRNARRDDRSNVVLRLHREVAARMGPIPPKHVVDHINGDTTDNRRSNLRVVPQSVNARNISRSHDRNASGVLGVQRSHGKWAARIMMPGKVSHVVGRFDTIEEATAARLRAERELWGIEPRRAAAHATEAQEAMA